MRARIKDIAKALELSASTVQSILRNKPGFRETTRQLVLKKAKALNYSPDWLARSLATRTTRVFGVVVPNLSRSIFPDILEGIDIVAHAAGYHLLVCNTAEDPAREHDEIATLVSKRVDGLIIASALGPGKNGAWKTIRKFDVPFVLVDRFFPSAPFVGADDEHIGYLATHHLIQQGYRRIAHLSRRSAVTGGGRYRGYLRALREAGLRLRRDYVVEVYGMPGGYKGTKRLLQLRPTPDAIFAAGDPIAVGAMQALQEIGARLPEDFGVVGVGNASYGEFLRVPLSTVDQHPIKIGESATTMLLSMVDGKPSPKSPVLLEPQLVVRVSSCRIPLSSASNSEGIGGEPSLSAGPPPHPR